jgi:hypothetical protein
LTIREELDVFSARADDFINSKYILADIKIVNLLKAIAGSDTLIALFKNCLVDFNYEQAKGKYLVKNKYLSEDKGEFILPPNSRELLAFIFNVLVDIDSKRIEFASFINKYFYVDGSFSSAYDAFITAMIKPFKNSVSILMESVINGVLQDPVEALVKEEERRAKEKEMAENEAKRQEELSLKAYGENIKKIKELLLADKLKVKKSKLSESDKKEITLIIDMLANVVESEDIDAIEYAFTAYKFLTKTRKLMFFGRVKKIQALIKDII